MRVAKDPWGGLGTRAASVEVEHETSVGESEAQTMIQEAMWQRAIEEILIVVCAVVK